MSTTEFLILIGTISACILMALAAPLIRGLF